MGWGVPDTPQCEWVRSTRMSKTRREGIHPRFRRNWMRVGVGQILKTPHPPHFRRFSTVSASSMASTTKRSYDTLRFRVVNGEGQGDSTVHRSARQISLAHPPPFSSSNETSRQMTPPFSSCNASRGIRTSPFSSSKCGRIRARLVLTPELLQPFADNSADSRLFVSFDLRIGNPHGSSP